MLYLDVGRDSLVGTATVYVLDGPGSIGGGGEIFYTHPDRPWGPEAFYKLVTGSLSWG